MRCDLMAISRNVQEEEAKSEQADAFLPQLNEDDYPACKFWHRHQFRASVVAQRGITDIRNKGRSTNTGKNIRAADDPCEFVWMEGDDGRTLTQSEVEPIYAAAREIFHMLFESGHYPQSWGTAKSPVHRKALSTDDLATISTGAPIAGASALLRFTLLYVLVDFEHALRTRTVGHQIKLCGGDSTTRDNSIVR